MLLPNHLLCKFRFSHMDLWIFKYIFLSLFPLHPPTLFLSIDTYTHTYIHTCTYILFLYINTHSYMHIYSSHIYLNMKCLKKSTEWCSVLQDKESYRIPETVRGPPQWCFWSWLVPAHENQLLASLPNSTFSGIMLVA